MYETGSELKFGGGAPGEEAFGLTVDIWCGGLPYGFPALSLSYRLSRRSCIEGLMF